MIGAGHVTSVPASDWWSNINTRQVAKEEKVVDILVNNAGLVTWRRELTEDGQ